MSATKLLLGIATNILFIFSTPCFAVLGCSEVYLGGHVGYAHNEYNMKGFFDKEYTNNRTAARVNLGYQLNPFFGIETGLSMISEAKLPDDSGQVATTSFDLLLKLGVPLSGTGFRIDLKGGAAYVISDFDITDVIKYYEFDDKSKKGEFKPVVGATLSFNLSSYFAIDATYLHFYDDPKSKTLNTPCTDLATIGVRLILSIV